MLFGNAERIARLDKAERNHFELLEFLDPQTSVYFGAHEHASALSLGINRNTKRWQKEHCQVRCNIGLLQCCPSFRNLMYEWNSIQIYSAQAAIGSQNCARAQQCCLKRANCRKEKVAADHLINTCCCYVRIDVSGCSTAAVGVYIRVSNRTENRH